MSTIEDGALSSLQSTTEISGFSFLCIYNSPTVCRSVTRNHRRSRNRSNVAESRSLYILRSFRTASSFYITICAPLFARRVVYMCFFFFLFYIVQQAIGKLSQNSVALNLRASFGPRYDGAIKFVGLIRRRSEGTIRVAQRCDCCGTESIFLEKFFYSVGTRR